MSAHRNLVHRLDRHLLDYRRATNKNYSKKYIKLLNMTLYSERVLTALISRSVKNEAILCLNGTIRANTKGKANEKRDDFTAHNSASAATCTIVYTCIFHVGTRFTNGSDGWYLTGMKNNRSLQGNKIN